MHSKALLVVALVVVLAAVILGGCSRPSATSGEGVPEAAGQAPATDRSSAEGGAKKMKVTAYINVSSGCQAETVDLLNNLGMDYSKLVDMEIVDFGSPEGDERWRAAGLKCMAILFDGSPAVKIPDEKEGARTVVFFMPAGLGWTHEDLKATFEALRDGKLQVLSPEEAKRELKPRKISLQVEIQDTDKGAQVAIDGVKAFVVQAGDQGRTARRRAEEFKRALEAWTVEPVHQSQLLLKPVEEGFRIQADQLVLIRVTQDDADKAGVELQKLANKWFKRIKVRVVAAMRKAIAAEEAAGEQQGGEEEQQEAASS